MFNKYHQRIRHAREPLREKRMIGRVNTPETDPQDGTEQDAENAQQGQQQNPRQQPQQQQPQNQPRQPNQQQAGGQERTNPAPAQRETSRKEIERSIWSISREWMRPKLFKTLVLAGALSFPALALAGYAGDKVLKNTVGKAPVVKHIYNKPREAIIGTAKWTSDRVADVVTAPTIPLDIAENVYEGVTGTTNAESKGTLGRILEVSAERSGAVVRGTFNAVKNTLGSVFGGLKNTGITSAPGKIVGGYAKWVAKHPWVGIPVTAIGGTMLAVHGPAGVWAFLKGLTTTAMNWAGVVP